MAEERLIDDDKDRKYKLVTNEKGETELIYNPEAEGEEGQATPADYFTPPEEMGKEEQNELLLSPEQLAAKREQEEREKKRRLEEAGLLCDKAKRDIKEKRYSTALEYLARAEGIEESEGEIYALRLTAYTRDFTDYSQIIKAAEDAEALKERLSEERKAELYTRCGAKLEEEITALRAKVTALNEQNEQGKAERAARFKKDITTGASVGGATLLLFAAFFATCVYYALSISASSPVSYVIYTAVFGALAFASFIISSLFMRKLITAVKRLKINRRNSSTQLGRDLLVGQATLRAYVDLNNALKVK